MARHLQEHLPVLTTHLQPSSFHHAQFSPQFYQNEAGNRSWEC